MSGSLDVYARGSVFVGWKDADGTVAGVGSTAIGGPNDVLVLEGIPGIVVASRDQGLGDRLKCRDRVRAEENAKKVGRFGSVVLLYELVQNIAGTNRVRGGDAVLCTVNYHHLQALAGVSVEPRTDCNVKI